MGLQSRGDRSRARIAHVADGEVDVDESSRPAQITDDHVAFHIVLNYETGPPFMSLRLGTELADKIPSLKLDSEQLHDEQE